MVLKVNQKQKAGVSFDASRVTESLDICGFNLLCPFR